MVFNSSWDALRFVNIEVACRCIRATKGEGICQDCHTRARIYRVAAVLRARKVPLALTLRDPNSRGARVYKHIIPS